MDACPLNNGENLARSDSTQNKQLVLDVFMRLVEQSDDVPTMSDVVRASGLGRATVYRHFPDIGSMAFAQLDEGYRKLFSEFRISLEELDDSGIQNSLLEFLSKYFNFSKANRTLLEKPECQNSSAYSLARTTLRALIFEALCRVKCDEKNEQTLKEISHIIACCSETEHWPKSTNKHSHEMAKEMIMKLISS